MLFSPDELSVAKKKEERSFWRAKIARRDAEIILKDSFKHKFD